MLQFRSNFELFETGPDESQNLLEELAAGERRLNHQGQFVLVLHAAQRFNQRRGKLDEKAAAKPRGQCGPIAGQVGHRGLGGVESNKLHAGLSGQPLDCSHGRRAFHNLDLGG